MMKTFNITHTSESTGYEPVVLATYAAATWRDALNRYYDEQHQGADVRFSWPMGGVMIAGRRYRAEEQAA
jgi:hypothetical protein